MNGSFLSSGTVNEAESGLWRPEAAATETCWTQISQITEAQPAETWASPQAQARKKR